MNISVRIRQPETADRTVGQGFSLLRRCHDSRLIDICTTLQTAFPDITVNSSINGKNRLGFHVLVADQLRQNAQFIATVGLRHALRTLIDEVPQLTDPLPYSTAELIIR